MKCKACKGDNVLKCICFGLPMKLCEDCSTGWGIRSYLFGYSNGQLMTYEGSYWRALWHWLFQSNNQGDHDGE